VALGPVVLEGEPSGATPMSMVRMLARALPAALFRRFSVLRSREPRPRSADAAAALGQQQDEALPPAACHRRARLPL